MEVAAAHGTTRSAIGLAWLLHQPGVTAPIIGASKPGHLQQAVDALAVKLSADELAKLAEPYLPRRTAGFS